MRAIAGVLLLVGCGAPAVVLDGQPCDDAGACPGEQACEPDGVCRYEPATTWIELVPGPELGVRLPGPGALAAGDLGGDGATDVVYGFGPRLSVYRGRADGLPAFVELSILPDDTTDVLIGDGDGDGVADLLVAVRREFGGAVLLFPSGALDAAPLELTTTSPVLGIALATVDSDPAPELIVQLSERALVAFAGATGSVFAADREVVAVDVPGATSHIGLAVADLDGDESPELITAGPSGEVYVIARLGTRQPAAAVARPALNPSTSALFAADFDDDGRADLGVIGGGRLRLFPSARTMPVDAAGEAFGPALVGDLNRDGRDDLVALTADGPAVWLRAPDHPAQLVNAPRLSGPTGDLALYDYDRDGRLDVISAEDETIRVFLQR